MKSWAIYALGMTGYLLRRLGRWMLRESEQMAMRDEYKVGGTD